MRVGEAVLPATWSHPDSLEPDMVVLYIIWEWVINERVESRRWRLYCVNIGFWMNVDFLNPESHVHVGVIVLTIFIFLAGFQHWWLGVALTITVGLSVILITVTQKWMVQWTALCSMWPSDMNRYGKEYTAFCMG
jgi:hypothetical protein